MVLAVLFSMIHTKMPINTHTTTIRVVEATPGIIMVRRTESALGATIDVAAVVVMIDAVVVAMTDVAVVVMTGVAAAVVTIGVVAVEVTIDVVAVGMEVAMAGVVTTDAAVATTATPTGTVVAAVISVAATTKWVEDQQDLRLRTVVEALLNAAVDLRPHRDLAENGAAGQKRMHVWKRITSPTPAR